MRSRLIQLIRWAPSSAQISASVALRPSSPVRTVVCTRVSGPLEAVQVELLVTTETDEKAMVAPVILTPGSLRADRHDADIDNAEPGPMPLALGWSIELAPHISRASLRILGDPDGHSNALTSTFRDPTVRRASDGPRLRRSRFDSVLALPRTRAQLSTGGRPSSGTPIATNGRKRERDDGKVVDSPWCHRR
jgi:hypothetical protein